MAKLPKFTLSQRDNGKWALTKDGASKATKLFDTKADATKGGVLKSAIGGEGSVKIQKTDGKFQEERTFPQSNDPPESPG